VQYPQTSGDSTTATAASTSTATTTTAAATTATTTTTETQHLSQALAYVQPTYMPQMKASCHCHNDCSCCRAGMSDDLLQGKELAYFSVASRRVT
jgi:hypothetical protein